MLFWLPNVNNVPWQKPLKLFFTPNTSRMKDALVVPFIVIHFDDDDDDDDDDNDDDVIRRDNRRCGWWASHWSLLLRTDLFMYSILFLVLYFSYFLLQWIQVALKPPLRRLNASTTVRGGDHCQTIFSTIAMLRFLTSVVSGLTGETGMCTFRNLPVGAQRRLKTTVPLSSVCSSTVSELTLLNKPH